LQANSGSNITYQWKLNNTDIAGATNQVYHATAVGDYKVITTNANGCTKKSKV